MKHVISFSGGKDSTAMLLMMIEKSMPIDRIIFCDTTKEFPAMYRHIQKVQEYIKKDIVILKSNKSFEEHLPNYGWSDFKNRWCTTLLKTNPTLKYIDREDIEYHGIAIDERHRAKNYKNRNIKYPLIDWQITEKMALEYCYSKGFDWEGLYEKFNRVSCWCCPLQRIGELRTLYNDFPELWQELREMDKKSFRKFRADRTVDDLDKKFKEENKQMCLQ
jgi:3'-phosphoadenosine 5'-phosphosulfate sulfotransferase (PAPS reductase)/FAD synthetase